MKQCNNVYFIEADIGAVLSPDRDYRYSLWRIWQPDDPYALFIGLNPSTADEYENDPTIRRCIRFAKDWGFGGLYMANLFAIRATKPKIMKAHHAPIGIKNDVWLQDLARGAGVIVCAWGTHGSHQGRDQMVKALLSAYGLMCLGTTKDGHPKHPLYIKAVQQLVRYGNSSASGLLSSSHRS
ncbi:MAG: DUF1643 domain-containing protein [Candidatus Thiodiazotropha sp. (ex Lucinoma kastoroae)]|nr:DUF1643 domain-containing protein [Candidatus Thiodiazotropha sp. (ex Lucinoma kastoroae)]MCU7859682.1 DUF1643 domain-containing protein [Candidatus Thiodiazotropha sp. (ex Lucinoma kastoroae)]